MKGQRIGFNKDPNLDYSTIGSNPTLAATYDAAVERLPYQKGRKILDKYSHPDFTKGKASKVAYPILQMSGANDWLVIPEFQRVFNTALDTGGKAHTQTWINTFGHCVFTPEEVTAVFNKFFEWLGPVGGPAGTQPTAAEVHQECLDIGGVEGTTCNFNDSFVPGYLYNRIPARSDWPAAAKP
jgi:hypothetical protein